MEDTQDQLNQMREKMNRGALLQMSLSEWPKLIAKECSVYRMGDQYIAKSYDQIPYRLCSKETAEDKLEENLDALLSFKYFPKATDEETERIKEIKRYCVTRIASSLMCVKFEEDASSAMLMKPLPPSCIPFQNGVYDFESDRWLFKYAEVPVPDDPTKSIISYPPEWRIMWYINQNFEPMCLEADSRGKMKLKKRDSEDSISPLSLRFDQWTAFMRESDKTSASMFWRLFSNMSLDIDGNYSDRRALHLAEIWGFLLYPAFAQAFVFFVGDGSNGKDSMFDGFFRSLIRPIPSTNSIASLEEDKFIAGSLSGVSQNISSETETTVLKKSAVLKQLTGSQFQTIEEKGVDKYTGYMNCKFCFSANKKEQLKFDDSSVGFRRRINLFECYFQWDRDKKFLKDLPQSYDTTYRDASELRAGDGFAEFFYTAVMGIREATEGFKKPFQFTVNDYTYSQYGAEDEAVAEYVRSLDSERFRMFCKLRRDEASSVFYTEDKSKLTKRSAANGVVSFQEGYPGMSFEEALDTALKYDPDASDENGRPPLGQWFLDNQFYVSVRDMLEMSDLRITKAMFVQQLKKIYPDCKIERMNANQSYVLCSFDSSGKLRIARR